MAVDFRKKENLKTLHNIDLGFAACTACTKAGSQVNVLKFREECLTYLQQLCTKLEAKCPLNHQLVKGATCLNPEIMLSDDLRRSRVTTALNVLISKNWLVPSTADLISRAYFEVCESSKVKQMLTRFCRDTDRLVFHHIFGEIKPDPAFQKFVQHILCLFHGNAAVERSFSLNKECLIENLLEDSLKAQRIVYDAVSDAGGIMNVNITKKLIQSVRSASGRRIEAAKKISGR